MDTPEAEGSTAIESSNGTEPEMPLSPVQRFNFDVLSIIFLVGWEHQEGFQLVVSSVCRRWREIVLLIPRLWTRIPIARSQNMDSVRLFLACSRPLPLHVFVPFWCKQPELFLEEKERIQCLKLYFGLKILTSEFPILRRLVIDIRAWANIDPIPETTKAGLFDVARYPMLSELSIERPHSLLMRAIAETLNLPPLQVLSIMAGHKEDLIPIIQRSAITLTSLKIRIGQMPPFINDILALPNLRHLSVSETVLADYVILRFEAPLLQSVHQVLCSQSPLRVTLQISKGQNVTDLHLCRVPFELAPYPRLRTLWIEGGLTDVQSRMPFLPDAISHCPELHSVRYRWTPSPTGTRGEEEDQIQLLIIEALKGTPRAINIEEFTHQAYELARSPLHEECERMSCSRSHP